MSFLVIHAGSSYLPLIVSSSAPAAPSSLACGTPGTTTMPLTWTDNSSGAATSFRVDYALDSGFSSGLVSDTDTGSASPSYTVTGLSSSTTYFFRVRAHNTNGSSGNSNTATAATGSGGSPPSIPANLQAVIGNAQLGLSWNASTGSPTGYKLYRGTTPGGEGGSPIATPSGTSYTNTGLSNGTTYYYKVSATNGSGDSGLSSEASGTPSSATAVAWRPDVISLATTKAAANTSQWQNFIATMDANLTDIWSNTLFTDYEVDGAFWIQEYAVAGIALLAAGTDNTKAHHYLQRALGLLRYCIRGAQKGGQGIMTRVGTGDGTTTAFPLPDANVDTSTIKLFQAPIHTIPVTRNGADTIDDLGSEFVSMDHFLKIQSALPTATATPFSYFLSTGPYTVTDGGAGGTFHPSMPITPDAMGAISFSYQPAGAGSVTFHFSPADAPFPSNVTYTFASSPTVYVQGTDWQAACLQTNIAGDKTHHWNASIDWSLGGTVPSNGSTYYLTLNYKGFALLGRDKIEPSSYTVTSNTVHFTTAPDVGKAILGAYLFGVPSNDSSTLGYQMTYDGLGYGDTPTIDGPGYGTRSVQYIASSAALLWDYVGTTPTDQTEWITWLAFYANWIAANGYLYGYSTSNYMAGHYAMLVTIANFLDGRASGGVSAPVVTEAKRVRNSLLLPQLGAPTATTNSLEDGHWIEGWNYGAFAVHNTLTAGLAGEQAGYWTATEEKAWASDVILAMLHEQPLLTGIYDGGDGYAFPLSFPQKYYLIPLLCASDSTALTYLNYIFQSYTGAQANNSFDVGMRDPAATTANPAAASLPLAKLLRGMGLVLARKDWNYNSTWLSLHCGNASTADHQPYDQGGLEVFRGGDVLLPISGTISGDQAAALKSRFASLVAFDDNGGGAMPSAFAQQFQYPIGNTISLENVSAYAYSKADSTDAWVIATENVRNLLYLRGPDYLFIYDRSGPTGHSAYVKRLQYHFLTGHVSLSAPAFTATVGSSKLFGKIFANVAITTTLSSGVTGGIDAVYTVPSSATEKVRYLTAMQIASSGTGSMDVVTYLPTDDTKSEGVMIGNVVAMFGLTGAIASPMTYTIAGAGSTITHYICNLLPNHVYTLGGAASGTPTSSAAGILTFTTPGAVSETITVI